MSPALFWILLAVLLVGIAFVTLVVTLARVAALEPDDAKEDEPVVYQPALGTRIEVACRTACDLATKKNVSVPFTFNGVDLVARPGNDWQALLTAWQQTCAARDAAYRNSPEGLKAAQEAEERRQNCQAATDALVRRLPEVVNDLDRLVPWVCQLSNDADHRGVQWEPAQVAWELQAAGWRTNAHVGRPQEAFQDRRVVGEYIVGQALDHLQRGLPPHPLLKKFARQRDALPH